MHVHYMAKYQLGQCRRGSKLGNGYVPDNHHRDIDGFTKKEPTIFIFQC